jgi:AraC-like DNA-binding protein
MAKFDPLIPNATGNAVAPVQPLAAPKQGVEWRTNRTLRRIQDWMPLARQSGWSVVGLAALCEVSPRTLQRHFLDTCRQTPEAYLADLRWRLALELLREGDSVKHTAAELGYRQASTFSREFKKRFGCSPAFFNHSLAPIQRV